MSQRKIGGSKSGTKRQQGKKAGNKLFSLAFIGLICLFLTVKLSSFSYNTGDENIYFYVSKLVADGKLPYRDFFHSHPPLGILINAAIFKIFGFNYLALKLMPVIAIALGSLFLYKAVQEAYDARTALLSCAIFLSSYYVLRCSAHSTGINETVLFMLASFYYFVHRNNFLCGLAIGIAGTAGLYAFVLFGCYCIYLLWKKSDIKTAIIPLAAGFLIVTTLVSGFFWLSAGWDYVNGVVLYHLNKPRMASQNLLIVEDIVKMNLLNILPAIGAIIFLSGKNGKSIDNLLVLITLAYAAFIANLSTIYDFYFMLLFPFTATLSSRSLILLQDRLKNNKTALIIPLIVLIYSAWSIPRYMNHEESYFEKAAEISNFVESHTTPAQEIFGDSTTVPLIALLSERRIALDEADTNYQRFTSGTTDISQMFSRLNADENFKYFIVANKGIGSLNQTVDYLRRECRLATKFADSYKGTYYVFDCHHNLTGNT